MKNILVSIFFVLMLVSAAFAVDRVIPMQGNVTANIFTQASNTVASAIGASAVGARWTLRYVGASFPNVAAGVGTCPLAVLDGSASALAITSFTTAGVYKELALPPTGLSGTAGNTMTVQVGPCGASANVLLNVIMDRNP